MRKGQNKIFKITTQPQPAKAHAYLDELELLSQNVKKPFVCLAPLTVRQQDRGIGPSYIG